MSSTQPPYRTLFSHTIYSAQLREERTIKIFNPVVSLENLPLPILYCQDGIEFFMFGRVATIVKGLIDNRQLPPILIAGVASSRRYRNEEYMPGTARNADYIEFFRYEAMEFVEYEYRHVLAPDQKPIRHLAGVSLGATIAMQLALRFPEAFQKLLLFSGAFYRRLAPDLRQHASLPSLSTYLLVGDEETAVETPLGIGNFVEDNLWLREMLQNKKNAIPI